MNGPLTTLVAGGVLAIVVVGASIASDDEGSPGDSSATATASPTSDPTEAPETRQPPETEPPTRQTPTSQKRPPEPPPKQERPTTFVGRVDGGGASVAVVVDGAEATAYFCDGADLEAWLSGSAADGRLTLSGDNGALRARLDDRRATGSVRVEGRRFGFTIRQVDAPQGLYRVADTISGAEVSGGWIVLPSGRQIGVVTVDGRTRPAPELDPTTGRVTIGGRTLTAEPQGWSE